MKTLGSRIKHYRNTRGWSQGELAEACGWVSQSRIGNYEVDKREPSMADLKVIADALGVPISALLDGSSDYAEGASSDNKKQKGYIRFPLLENFAGMGRGDYIGDYPEIVNWVEVTREWAMQKLQNVPHAAIRVITGRGQSMRGVFSDGDLIFVDSRVKEFEADDIYVLRWHGRVQIKRLQFIGNGQVRILSANSEDYPPIDADLKDIEIGGRAIAAWTLVTL